MKEVDRFISYLENSGLRVTRQRRKVAEIVLGAGGHCDAESLYELCRASDRNISRATLYRTLEHLRNSGLIREMSLDRSKSYYEPQVGKSRHDHMICLDCGEIIEFSDDGIDRLQDRAVRRAGFIAQHHSLKIFGNCRKCSKE